MIKVITGIRRCGKSFLLFNLFRQYLLEHEVGEDHIIQVNMEDRRNKKYRDPDRLLEYIDAQMVDGFRKIIVAGDRYTSGYNEDGILIVGLYDFLFGKFDIWSK